MNRYKDETVVFTKQEMQSLIRLVIACTSRISSLANDGDFLGWSHYRALCMWEDKLKGEVGGLDDYVGDTEIENETTVDEWLEAYGMRKRRYYDDENGL